LQLDAANKKTYPKAEDKKTADEAAQKAVSVMCLLSARLQQLPQQLPVGKLIFFFFASGCCVFFANLKYTYMDLVDCRCTPLLTAEQYNPPRSACILIMNALPASHSQQTKHESTFAV
jgi:hypothetical protein